MTNLQGLLSHVHTLIFTELEMLVNLSYSFILVKKMLHLPYILTISFRQRLLLLTHMLSAITHR